MEPFAFCALVRNDEVKLRGKEFTLESGRRCTVVKLRSGEVPFCTGFIDSRIGTFRFAGATVDAITRDVDGHGVLVLLVLWYVVG